MDRGFTAGKLHYLRVPFGTNVVVENVLYFFKRQGETRSRFGKAQGTGHVAGAIHFDDSQAGMLLMVGT